MTRSAGAAYVPPAAANAAASTRRWSSRPRRSSGPGIASKSSSFVWTTMPGVRVARSALVARHSVRHDAAGLRRAGDDLAAGAHAERVDPAAVRGDVRLLVVGGHHAARRRDLRVLDEVDGVLRVLDPHAHREVLARHRDAAREEHVHRVARRVAEREDRDVGRDVFARLERQAGERPVRPGPDVRDLRAVTQRGAVLEEVLAHVAQDDDEPVRPDVRLGVHEDRRGRPEAVERLEDDLRPCRASCRT